MLLTALLATLQITLFDSAPEALKSLLGAQPRVIAFGEYHQTTGTAKIKSALKRFSEQLLPVVQAGATDLVLETWITEGHCGKEEKAAVKDVQKTTQRPQATESEIVTLAKRAKAGGIQPHVLTVTCADYRELFGAGGAVDYEKMLGLVTRLLRDKITDVLSRRAPAEPGKMILVYGGGLHNDLFPRDELVDYTFGPAIQQAVGGRYLEVDLYVPEYLQGDKSIQQEPWYRLYNDKVRPGQNQKKTVLIQRGPGSYIIVFAKSGR